MKKVVIETENLSKYYGKDKEIKALDELNIEVFEGETFGLLGPNGAGKTTAVRLLNGIIKPSGGTARVNGFDIVQQEDEVKRVTGMLAESPGLYEKLSAREFLEFMGALYDVPPLRRPQRRTGGKDRRVAQTLWPPREAEPPNRRVQQRDEAETTYCSSPHPRPTDTIL
jgi:ABC-2 type transport system ATP-binding protein